MSSILPSTPSLLHSWSTSKSKKSWLGLFQTSATIDKTQTRRGLLHTILIGLWKGTLEPSCVVRSWTALIDDSLQFNWHKAQDNFKEVEANVKTFAMSMWRCFHSWTALFSKSSDCNSEDCASLKIEATTSRQYHTYSALIPKSIQSTVSHPHCTWSGSKDACQVLLCWLQLDAVCLPSQQPKK